MDRGPNDEETPDVPVGLQSRTLRATLHENMSFETFQKEMEVKRTKKKEQKVDFSDDFSFL